MSNVSQELTGASRLSARRWHRHDEGYQTAVAAAAADPGYAAAYSIDWWLICGSLLALMGANALGSPLVALALLFGLILCARNLRLMWGTTLYYLPLQIFCAFALLSTFWSEAPGLTSRLASELAITFLFALTLSRRVSPREFASAFLLAGTLICLVPYVTSTSWLSGATLVGPFGSKNFLAFMAQIVFATGLAVMIDRCQGWLMRLIGVVGVVVGFVDVILAHSAGAIVTLCLSAAVFIPFVFMDRLPRAGRFALLAGLVVCFAPLLFAVDGVRDQIQWVQTEVLHKDATLTNRTNLWHTANDLIAQRPWFGRGFGGFWRPGNPDAEAIWTANGIANNTGFNFHSQFLDAQVDGGIFGAAILGIMLFGIAVASLWRGLSKPSVYSAYFIAMLVALYSRLPVESTLLGPWNIFTILLIAAAVHAFSPEASIKNVAISEVD